jgi:hypothetical protein
LAGVHADRNRAEAVAQAVLQLKQAGIEELSAALQALADDGS